MEIRGNDSLNFTDEEAHFIKRYRNEPNTNNHINIPNNQSYNMNISSTNTSSNIILKGIVDIIYYSSKFIIYIFRLLERIIRYLCNKFREPYYAKILLCFASLLIMFGIGVITDRMFLQKRIIPSINNNVEINTSKNIMVARVIKEKTQLYDLANLRPKEILKYNDRRNICGKFNIDDKDYYVIILKHKEKRLVLTENIESIWLPKYIIKLLEKRSPKEAFRKTFIEIVRGKNSL